MLSATVVTSFPRSGRVATERANVWSDTDAAWFARCQRRSDGITTIAAAITAVVGPQSDLLDIGAGTGALGTALLAPEARYRAIEPSAEMVRRLSRLRRQRVRDISVEVLAAPWQQVLPEPRLQADSVLAANIPGLVEGAAALWPVLRAQARRHLMWVVPAQAGPRTWCCAGFLPPHLHGLEGSGLVPGVDQTLTALTGCAPTPQRLDVAWTWRAAFPSRRAAVRWFAPRIAQPDDPDQQRTLVQWCDQRLRRSGSLWIAEAPKRSAILIWSTKATS